jgi:hypothetical protein
MKLYRLRLVQALRHAEKGKRVEFCAAMLNMENDDEDSFSRIIFSDEATFHVSGCVNHHNVWIWGTEHPRETTEHERDSPKVNVFCTLSNVRVYGPSSRITLSQDKAISKCYEPGSSLCCKHTHVTSFFNKMEPHPIGAY